MHHIRAGRVEDGGLHRWHVGHVIAVAGQRRRGAGTRPRFGRPGRGPREGHGRVPIAVIVRRAHGTLSLPMPLAVRVSLAVALTMALTVILAMILTVVLAVVLSMVLPMAHAHAEGEGEREGSRWSHASLVGLVTPRRTLGYGAGRRDRGGRSGS